MSDAKDIADSDNEIAAVWAQEALRRDTAMAKGQLPSVPAEEVLSRLRLSLQGVVQGVQQARQELAAGDCSPVTPRDLLEEILTEED